MNNKKNECPKCGGKKIQKDLVNENFTCISCEHIWWKKWWSDE